MRIQHNLWRLWDRPFCLKSYVRFLEHILHLPLSPQSVIEMVNQDQDARSTADLKELAMYEDSEGHRICLLVNYLDSSAETVSWNPVWKTVNTYLKSKNSDVGVIVTVCRDQTIWRWTLVMPERTQVVTYLAGTIEAGRAMMETMGPFIRKNVHPPTWKQWQRIFDADAWHQKLLNIFDNLYLQWRQQLCDEATARCLLIREVAMRMLRHCGKDENESNVAQLDALFAIDPSRLSAVQIVQRSQRSMDDGGEDRFARMEPNESPHPLDTWVYTTEEDDGGEYVLAIDPGKLALLYERMRTNAARHDQGIYYTPQAIVEAMCVSALSWKLSASTSMSQTVLHQLLEREANEWNEERKKQLHPLKNVLSKLRVVDPAAGTGAFVVTMARIMAKILHVLHPHFSLTMWLKHIIHEQIFAVDLDPGAIALLRLRLWLMTGCSSHVQETGTIVGDALCDNWGKTWFPTIFTEQGGFDLVIGNPPYVDSETMNKQMPERRKMYASQFETAKGNWDLYVVFVEKGTTLLAHEGVLSFIVPNTLVSARYTMKLREYLCDYCLLEITDYSKNRYFPNADVYPLTFVLQRSSKRSAVRIGTRRQVSQEVFYRDIHWGRYLTENGEDGLALIEHMMSFPQLSQFAQVNGAATVGEAYALKKVLREWDERLSEVYFRFINSGTIDPYVSLWGKQPTRYIKSSYLQPVVLRSDLRQLSSKRLQEASSPKLIIAGMTRRMEGFLDEEGLYVAGKSTTIVMADLDMLRYIEAILNSRLMTVYSRIFHSALTMSQGYMRLGPPQIRALPLPDPDKGTMERCAALVDEVKRGMTASDMEVILQAQTKLDAYVCEMFQVDASMMEAVWSKMMRDKL